jgi:hypothetical protein
VESQPRAERATSRSGTSLAGSAGLVSLATGLSRIGGLVREQLFASLMGAGFYSDAFVVAFRIPNLLRDLLAEGGAVDRLRADVHAPSPCTAAATRPMRSATWS